MNRVHVIGQHKGVDTGTFYINCYVREQDRYYYKCRLTPNNIDSISETPLETINYLKSNNSTFKIELLYD
jgi:hypothetical protein